jgi:hypothetical protein
MFEQFVQFQDRILAIVERTEAMLDQDDPALPGLAQIRWQFCRALQEYELYFHNNILDHIARHRPDRAREASALKAAPIGPSFRAHVMKWSAISPADHWQEYRDSCRDGLPRLCSRLLQERAAVATLLDVGLPLRTR